MSASRDKDLDWFKAGPVRYNERGEQILGSILAAYLSLDTEPDAKP